MTATGWTVDSIALRVERDAVLLPLRVKPRGRAGAVEGARNGALLLSVTAAPSDGKANAAVIETLARALDVPKSSLAIVRGQTARDKTVRLSGLSLEEVRRRLAAL